MIIITSAVDNVHLPDYLRWLCMKSLFTLLRTSMVKLGVMRPYCVHTFMTTLWIDISRPTSRGLLADGIFLWQNGWLNHIDGYVEIFPAKWVITMAADSLPPYLARSAGAMLLTMINVDIFVVVGSRFQQPVIFQCRAIIWKANIYFRF